MFESSSTLGEWYYHGVHFGVGYNQQGNSSTDTFGVVNKSIYDVDDIYTVGLAFWKLELGPTSSPIWCSNQR